MSVSENIEVVAKRGSRDGAGVGLSQTETELMWKEDAKNYCNYTNLTHLTGETKERSIWLYSLSAKIRTQTQQRKYI